MFGAFGFAQGFFGQGPMGVIVLPQAAMAASVIIEVRADAWQIVVPADPAIVPVPDPVVKVET